LRAQPGGVDPSQYISLFRGRGLAIGPYAGPIGTNQHRRFDLSVIAIVGILLLIGIVHKNGIMLVDFAMQAEQSEGLTTEESIYPRPASSAFVRS
jgi:AcrB/AcrD/AcrF family